MNEPCDVEGCLNEGHKWITRIDNSAMGTGPVWTTIEWWLCTWHWHNKAMGAPKRGEWTN